MTSARLSPLIIPLLIFIFSNQLWSGEKSSKDIQKDIDSRKTQLQSLRNEIKDIEDKLHRKNKEAISNTEILLSLENKIVLTEKLIRSLNKEERYINGLIQTTEKQIHEMETLLAKLKKQLTQRLQYLYVHGRPTILETVLLAEDWNNAIYRIKYLDVLAEYEKILRQKMKQTLVELSDEKIKLVIERNRKTSLLNEKKNEGANLERDKQKRKNILASIKRDKDELEASRSTKTQVISEMEALIKKLYSDKAAMKKREEELARIRAERNKATTGNFAKMKGKLPWPVQGPIIRKFGTSRNPNTGVVTENVGIDIQANSGAFVKSVLDGVVSTITYIRGHGNIIIIDHGGGFSTVYAQIDKITVHENEYVQKGNAIASVVKAEDGSVSKLHFEVWGNQNKLNPEIWLIRQ
ncbi:MAG TPA: peptidoglycan DD-metalloendopeptidase family protein [Candidatus Marinimicrobia bacterium]|nr:peptidoglycan DD-metalloendopeptidase family protein [Candidatus Neomarinimicrobiota bacterium]HJM83730.1 peptidoglycan DD-metalloendopeptidase family protein [Candidatus Neomarinimicrobiota bacterium]